MALLRLLIPAWIWRTSQSWEDRLVFLTWVYPRLRWMIRLALRYSAEQTVARRVVPYVSVFADRLLTGLLACPLDIYRFCRRGVGIAHVEAWRSRTTDPPLPVTGDRPRSALPWVALFVLLLIAVQASGDPLYALAAFPVVYIDSTDGAKSDSACSGAGPATAISGSTGRTRNTASQTRFGFFGATDDLSGIATDGSHVLYMGIATAGARNHSTISGIKDTRQTGADGAITTGTAILTVGSTTTWTAGDVVKVVGAGAAAADLYSTVLTVDSGTQATLNDNAGTTVGPTASWENPKQATLTTGEEVNTGATNTAWACGGVRATIHGTNSQKLINNNSAAGDAMPGWIVEFKSGHAETTSTTTSAVRRAGNTTNGPITLRGATNAATVPAFTFSANGNGFDIRVNYIHLDNIRFRKTTSASVPCVNYSSLATAIASINRLWIDGTADLGVANWTAGMYFTGNPSFSNVSIRNCFCDSITGYFVDAPSGGGGTTNGGMFIVNNYVKASTGLAQMPRGVTGVVIIGNICKAATGYGLILGTTNGGPWLIMHNTIDGSVLDGIRIDATGRWPNTTILNNNITNGSAYGINASVASVSFFGDFVNIDGNNLYNNSSGPRNNVPTGANDLNVDPGYTNASTGDYRVGTAMRAKGVPIGGSTYIGYQSATYTYPDIGAAQRLESDPSLSVVVGL